MTEQSYTVEDQITRIVGKNESGNTALLEALAKSNYFEDNSDFQYNKDLDYPRSDLIKVRNQNPDALTCEYELSDEDVENIEDDFAAGIISKRSFSLTSRYDNTCIVTGITVNFGVFKDWLIASFDVGSQGKELLHKTASFSDLETAVAENETIPGMKEIQTMLTKIKKGAGKWICFFPCI